MSSPEYIFPRGWDRVPAPWEREKFIRTAINNGKIVRFTNKKNGITKDVNKWEPDEDGDLTAFRHTGKSASVCWQTEQYELSLIDE